MRFRAGAHQNARKLFPTIRASSRNISCGSSCVRFYPSEREEFWTHLWDPVLRSPPLDRWATKRPVWNWTRNIFIWLKKPFRDLRHFIRTSRERKLKWNSMGTWNVTRQRPKWPLRWQNMRLFTAWPMLDVDRAGQPKLAALTDRRSGKVPAAA